MGDESTLQAIIDDAEVSQMDDPIMRFHPELSMDGLSQHGQEKTNNFEIINDEECEIGQLEGTQSIKSVKNTKNIKNNESKSMSFLTSVTNNSQVEVKERNFEALSFSGLFSQQKRKSEESFDENASKKIRMGGFESDEDMFADDGENDENVDNTNNLENDKEDALIPLNEIKDDFNEEPKEDRRKAKNPKKHNGLVSNNFVKIDMKKKNYVRGSNNMTGSKYKRQEWKRKVQQKFGNGKR